MSDVKFSNQYPYTDFHELNLDWVISQVKYWSTKVGKTIQSIDLTGTAGLVDTYTITYSDGSTSTFDVTNGNGIASIAKTGTVGLVDTYTITFQDGSTTTFDVTNGTAAVDPTLTLSDYAADAKATGDAIRDISDLFTTRSYSSSNLLNPANVTSGYYWTDGHHPSSSYVNTGLIELEPGVTYTEQYGFDDQAINRTIAEARFVVYYAADGTTVVSGTSYVTNIQLPAGAKYIIATYGATSVASFLAAKQMIVDSVVPVDYEAYFAPYSETRLNNSSDSLRTVAMSETLAASKGVIMRFDLNSDNVTGDNDIQDMGGYRYSFFGNITTFGGVIIGRGWNEYMGRGIGIDSVNVNVYSGASTTPVFSYPHGLTFSDYVAIDVSIDYGIRATVNVRTNGGTYTKTDVPWDGRSGALYCRSVSTNVMTGCSLGYYCTRSTTDTWMFGDSYFGFYSDRWTYYLYTAGHYNYLLNGYPGRASLEALNALKVDLKLAKPRRIIWCLGMNDGDTGAVNSNWMSAVSELETICDTYDIELILATIPNVPSVDNSYKNAWVESSGYRYIDFATAVGAHNGTTWYNGMLSGDNVHPTDDGAIALFSQAVATVPELLE